MKKFTVILVFICVLFSTSCAKTNPENFDGEFVDKSSPIKWDITEDFIIDVYDNFFMSVPANAQKTYSLYQKEITYFNDLDKNFVYFVIYRNNIYLRNIWNLNLNYKDVFEIRYTENIDPEDFEDFESEYYRGYIIPIEVFDETLHKLYGLDIVFEHETFSPFNGSLYYYEENHFYLAPNNNGGGDFFENIEQNYLLSAESQGDYLYLYDKYAKVTYVFDQYQGAEIMFFSIYADSKCEILLKELSGDESIEFYNNRYNYFGYFNKHSQSFYEEYGDIMQPYKHTFKKAEDGSYYWVSTEMISEIPES